MSTAIAVYLIAGGLMIWRGASAEDAANRAAELWNEIAKKI